MHFDMVRPCPHCPFRSDIPAYLTPSRAKEIADSLERSSFPCHQTTVDVEADEGGSDRRATADSQQCAGALLFMEKQGRSSQMTRIAERLGMLDVRKLDYDAPVYTSTGAFVNAQPKRNRVKPITS